jgi:hypothetical protein
MPTEVLIYLLGIPLTYIVIFGLAKQGFMKDTEWSDIASTGFIWPICLLLISVGAVYFKLSKYFDKCKNETIDRETSEDSVNDKL